MDSGLAVLCPVADGKPQPGKRATGERRLHAKTPIVMLTGWGAMMKADGETVPDVDVLLSKPPHLQELNNLLLQITARRN
jgi:hypothetical protein